jgi:hypothetical protein
VSSENNHSNEIKVEKTDAIYKIVRMENELKLMVDIYEQCEILVVDETQVYEAPKDWIFRRSQW